jgi:hypothetical protein
MEVVMSQLGSSRLRRVVVYVALATLLGAVSLTLSQCTLVGDSLTGVGLNKGNATNCIAQCSNLYATLSQEEQKLHLMNLDLCGGNLACIEAENARHLAADAALKNGKEECKANCHVQGGGTAG